MRQDLLLFLQLVLFLTGALLYGFLARELFRQPRVLPGLPMRLLAVSLTIWPPRLWSCGGSSMNG